MQSIDKIIIGTFLAFFIFAITIDYINSVAPVNEKIRNENTSKWLWPPQAFFKLFYENVDPVLFHNNSFVKYLTCLSSFLFAPFYVTAIYAIYHKHQWIRKPMILFSLILFFDLNYFFYQALFGREKMKNLFLFTLAYGYYQLFPLILIYRFWPKKRSRTQLIE
ncbi:unnamed protein product [Didymodactylos carnosus]|uniref:EXPERA domain-containing protein n=1 Tax=Didymodactylos carnosus TaxID=1234261 RepID=A0A814X090_9BILA|nr:unnamed protein product [Didymodactylos carnosus]CAF1209453.1 unnamed protein product [Didymodactylos carnosus]CAF3835215.1 unnamed protein product [Didymodactylos carnosus]CAF3973539.1 unnamed protein product [Didymodactylos carnosus]